MLGLNVLLVLNFPPDQSLLLPWNVFLKRFCLSNRVSLSNPFLFWDSLLTSEIGFLKPKILSRYIPFFCGPPGIGYSTDYFVVSFSIQVDHMHLFQTLMWKSVGNDLFQCGTRNHGLIVVDLDLREHISNASVIPNFFYVSIGFILRIIIFEPKFESVNISCNQFWMFPTGSFLYPLDMPGHRISIH